MANFRKKRKCGLGYGNGSITVDGISNIDRRYGGGMFNRNSSSPILTNVSISGNSLAYSGGYGGGMCNYSSSPVLTNVTISGNRGSNGGGMYNSSSSPVLTNVTISGNSTSDYGGGMFNRNSSSPVLTNVTISGNSASDYGGGMYNIYSSSPVLTNVTISGNSAGSHGGGMSNWSSSAPAIRNSIVWGNTAPSNPVVYNSSSTPVFSNSIVQGGYTGTGNLATDPLFVSPDPASSAPTAGGDYRLNAASPAINAGNNGNYPANADDTIFPAGLSDAAKAAINAALPYDRDGTARKKGGAIDMGAYEKQ